MHGATGTESTTDERTDEHTDARVDLDRADDRTHDLTESALSPDEVARTHDVEDARPLVRHGSDLLDLVAGGVPFAVAHDVRAATPRRADPSGD
ncbi:hypothetical protein [Cellulomonas sp. NS3]|uniref:hypothetical protein n=1 Tax=Cellulomonas sp. NS3 TaxID=2973977 RepID=UPI002163B08C|nr:hypothetical protein [Cellulomonas sp. NS3]